MMTITKSSLVKPLRDKRAALALVVGLLVVPSAATAADTDGLLYVIKVTPTLLYLDGGAAAVDMGERFLVLRDRGRGEGLYDKVGEVRVIRRFEEFSIAEILSVAEGAQIEVLQRAISAADWEALASATAGAPGAASLRPGGTLGPWSIHLVGGADLAKGVDLQQDTKVTPAKEIADATVGLRLGRTYAGNVRLNLTLRISGDPLGVEDADVTQLSLELDGHYVFVRGPGSVRPYVGIGAGLHRLTWDTPADSESEDSAVKVGFNAVGGLEIPLGRNGWSLMLEGGYQGVVQWNDIIDASSIRVHAGIGRNF